MPGQPLTNNGTINLTTYAAYVDSNYTFSGNPPVRNIDYTAPTVNPIQSPAADNNGWNDSDVTVIWRWGDNTGGSGIDTTHCTATSTSSGEGAQTLTATCQDKAGNVGSASYTVKVDKGGPTANPTQSPAANAAGWNNTEVTVTWN